MYTTVPHLREARGRHVHHCTTPLREATREAYTPNTPLRETTREAYSLVYTQRGYQGGI